ncbi:hypothetical protein MtrunA17_Chr4g0045351 [Medicago truncatula]|uniref:Uncharacterized protein n=1 Tax=Medicago truncatula TaxID=3880 RepID=A0A396IHA9_MEDTR|nr:hypothetical protein MtrunA17_Chr4g0045351 [Medicago truncatula]
MTWTRPFIHSFIRFQIDVLDVGTFVSPFSTAYLNMFWDSCLCLFYFCIP